MARLVRVAALALVGYALGFVMFRLSQSARMDQTMTTGADDNWNLLTAEATPSLSFEYGARVSPAKTIISRVEGSHSLVNISFERSFLLDDAQQLPHFAIIVATYPRLDTNRTRSNLRALAVTLRQQKYTLWTLVLVGDHFDKEEEFKALCKLFPSKQLIAVNLPYAAEREYPRIFSGRKLWCSGGVHAINTGLDIAEFHGFTHIVRMDDDDKWAPTHLRNLAEGYILFPNASYIYTQGFYRLPNSTLPKDGYFPKLRYNNLRPAPNRIVHSAVSWRLDMIPQRYRSTEEIGKKEPADRDMWKRLRAIYDQSDLDSLYIPCPTASYYNEAPNWGRCTMSPYEML